MKDIFIKFRVSKLESLVVKNKARERGVSVSQLIRHLVFNYKLSAKLTKEEVECYLTLTKFADNFRRISNLFKLGDVEGMKKEVLETSRQIREHLMKLK